MSTDYSDPTSVKSLEETGLVGRFQMARFKLAYDDGTTVTNAQVSVAGTLTITADSGFTQTVRISTNPEIVSTGKVTSVKVESGDSRKGVIGLVITSDGNTKLGSSGFRFSADTLITSSSANKQNDPRGIGFTESDYWVRLP